MSLAALSTPPDKFIHSEVDLESILYSILVVCTYTTGPGILRRPIDHTPSIPMNRWFCETSRHELARKKSCLLGSFDKYIGDRLPAYWRDFTPYLQRLIRACWAAPYAFVDQPNLATHEKFIEILDDVIRHYGAIVEELNPYANIPEVQVGVSIPGKRARNEDCIEDPRHSKSSRGARGRSSGCN
jgi:hypothetical protein